MSKWTPEIVAYICSQYLEERKSAGEIAKALNYAFSRNAVTGKLLRVGALGQRKGIDLGKQITAFPKSRLCRRRALRNASPSAKPLRPRLKRRLRQPSRDLAPS